MLLTVIAALCLLAPSVICGSCEQDIENCKKGPLDIAFVVDNSASIWPVNFTEGLWFIQNVVDKFDIGPNNVRVSMVTYGDKVYSEDAFDFDKYKTKESLKKAIGNIKYRAGSSTATGAAIAYMLDKQIPKARKGVRKVSIVLTDGNSQETEVTKQEADRALSTGLEVFAIGVGKDISDQELHNIASDNKHVFNVGRFNLLDDILDRLLFETCGVAPVPDCSYDPVDIAFVIDSSVSIGQENFTLGLEFIKEFIKDFQVNPSSARIAAIMYGDRVYTESAIHFDEYNNEKDTEDAILGLKWMHGTSTETGDGISYMINNFVPNMRQNAAHLGIVITDGESQDTDKTANSAALARSRGVTMIAVGIGKVGFALNEAELNSIAGSPERVLIATDYSKLNLIKDTLIKTACLGIEISLQVKQAAFYK